MTLSVFHASYLEQCGAWNLTRSVRVAMEAIPSGSSAVLEAPTQFSSTASLRLTSAAVSSKCMTALCYMGTLASCSAMTLRASVVWALIMELLTLLLLFHMMVFSLSGLRLVKLKVRCPSLTKVTRAVLQYTSRSRFAILMGVLKRFWMKCRRLMRHFLLLMS